MYPHIHPINRLSDSNHRKFLRDVDIHIRFLYKDFQKQFYTNKRHSSRNLLFILSLMKSRKRICFCFTSLTTEQWAFTMKIPYRKVFIQ